MRLYEHTTQRMREISNLTDEALRVHLDRIDTAGFRALVESGYGKPYADRRDALRREASERGL